VSNDSVLSVFPATPVTGALPADHWDALFAAVTGTLRETATRPRSQGGPTEWPSRETTILECVRQLELLHEALRGERALADRSLRGTSTLLEALLAPSPVGPRPASPAGAAQSVRPPPALSSAQSSSCTGTR